MTQVDVNPYKPELLDQNVLADQIFNDDATSPHQTPSSMSMNQIKTLIKGQDKPINKKNRQAVSQRVENILDFQMKP